MTLYLCAVSCVLCFLKIAKGILATGAIIVMNAASGVVSFRSHLGTCPGENFTHQGHVS